MPDRQTVGIEEDIERLELGIRQLKIQYDMFFAGAIPKQPLDLRVEIERLIKRCANSPMRKYVHRFHFNSLSTRYSSLTEFWARTLRGLEEGDRPPAIVHPRAPGDDEKILARCRIHDPLHEQEMLKVLHARFLDAREKGMANGGKVSFESFLRGITAQADRMRAVSGCEQVELRLVLHEGKVLLKARPGR